MGTKRYVKFYHLLVLCVIVFILSGCAIMKPPAFSSKTNTVDVSKESIALFTVKIANEYKRGYQPNIKFITVWSDLEKERKYSFKVDEKYRAVKKSFNEYLISFQLPPGKYKLRVLFAQTIRFPAIGTFHVPVYSSFSIEPHKIIYLGRIEATVKKRTDDKMLRAGPVIPLLDQAIAGASGGTFVVNITDSFENDIKLFQQKYPYLNQHQIDNFTLPQ